jgi:sarcosine oxidase
MNSTFDVAVIGAGAMGSSAVYHLAKTGRKILLLDQYTPPHHFGSSHGESRIIREAYFESPVYVPLVQQAYRLWDALEKESGKKLFLKTGGLMLGNRERRVFQGASASALQYNVPYEYLDSAAIKKRFPAFKPSEGTVALYEQNAGILFPEECISTQLQLAKRNGVSFHFDETVTSIQIKEGRVEIITGTGQYSANKVIVSAGAWLPELFLELRLPLSVKRQVLFWFKCKGGKAEKFSPARFPVYIWEHEASKIFYGFPDLGDGLKIAIHHEGRLTTADTVDRDVSNEEINEVTTLLNRFFDVEATFDRSAVCMYTNTPDEDFIIDYHPSNKNIILVSAYSGHGFKFSSAIGKILCEMIIEKPLSFDISIFNIQRLVK